MTTTNLCLPTAVAKSKHPSECRYPSTSIGFKTKTILKIEMLLWRHLATWAMKEPVPFRNRMRRTRCHSSCRVTSECQAARSTRSRQRYRGRSTTNSTKTIFETTKVCSAIPPLLGKNSGTVCKSLIIRIIYTWIVYLIGCFNSNPICTNNNSNNSTT